VTAADGKIAVNQLTWRVIGTDLEIPLPDWAIDFVHRIDADRTCGDPVSASMARAALESEAQ
jgi:hypothetical protein